MSILSSILSEYASTVLTLPLFSDHRFHHSFTSPLKTICKILYLVIGWNQNSFHVLTFAQVIVIGYLQSLIVLCKKIKNKNHMQISSSYSESLKMRPLMFGN